MCEAQSTMCETLQQYTTYGSHSIPPNPLHPHMHTHAHPQVQPQAPEHLDLLRGKIKITCEGYLARQSIRWFTS